MISTGGSPPSAPTSGARPPPGFAAQAPESGMAAATNASLSVATDRKKAAAGGVASMLPGNANPTNTGQRTLLGQ